MSTLLCLIQGVFITLNAYTYVHLAPLNWDMIPPSVDADSTFEKLRYIN